MYTSKGRCACAGITYGKILHLHAGVAAGANLAPGTGASVGAGAAALSVGQELERLEQALLAAKQELEDLINKARQEIGDEEAEIFEIHLMILDDPDIADNIRTKIREGLNAEQAALKVGEEQAQEFAALDDPYMSARASDIKDITARLARLVRGEKGIILTEPVILVAEDLQPSETIALDRSKILGIVLSAGTQNSHASILARTMNIPLIIHAKLPHSLAELDASQVDAKASTTAHAEANSAHAEASQTIAEAAADQLNLSGLVMGLDAVHETFYIKPDESTLQHLQAAKDIFDQQRIRQLGLIGQTGVSKTGHRIYTFANIGQVDDVEQALANDAEGIGLFRSEFLYLGRTTPPDEEEQYNAYSKVAGLMRGKLVIIRTLDIGADKKVDYFDLPKEENPAMGMRALRICLTRPEIFKVQLRAIYRAAAVGNVAMMFPMVTRPEEVIQAKAICKEVEQELEQNNMPYRVPKIGIMIETPAAAILSDKLAQLVDFFSVGTNDLNQYTTACDRQNEHLGDFYDAHHEAVLELLRLIAKNAHAAGITAGICGELAGDPALTDLFVEMGYDELSVSPGAVLALRERIRNSQAVCQSELKEPRISLEPVKLTPKYQS